MEVATKTSNNNHSSSKNSNSHHLLQHHQDQQRMPHHSQNSLSLSGTGTGGVNSDVGNVGGSHSPFQREVREWQRIDPDTGALLTGRLEADRWINGPMNKYGKISDSQNISQPNGTQHTQRKQLEVLQARTANGGAMQVIRTQTVQTTSSRWSSSTSSASSSAVASPTITMSALTNGHNINGISNSSISNSNSFHNNSSLYQQQQHHHHHLNNNIFKHSHFQSPSFGRLSLSMADSPPPLISTLEISEVSSNSNNNNVNNNNNNHNGSSSHSCSNSSRSGSDLEDIDDDSNCGDAAVQQRHYHHHHADVDVDVDVDVVGGTNDLFNRHSVLNKSHNNIANRNLSLLMETLDTAPSLKLSNLMKSNSSISSNNSSSNNSTTTAMNNNTHYSNSVAGKISLHAIVGDDSEEHKKSTSTLTSLTSTLSKSASSSSSSTLSSTATKQTWQQHQQKQSSSRFFEQPTLYGNGSLSLSPSLTKSRVGVSTDETGGAGSDASVVVHNNDDMRQRLQTPTQLKSRQQRRDLESFRHYNDHGSKTATSLTASTLNKTNDHDSDNNDYDDMVRVSTRHQRRQQPPANNSILIQRSRSISTDDLNTERERQTESNDDTDLEPCEWKRVSKLRRSFQSTNSTKTDISIQPRKPIDLPTNASVSVAKIRAELENGRRLNTAMRNNHVDLAALDSILNNSIDDSLKREPSKRNSFLTAESLKEIRAGLKKLSDETLYRDDYLASIQASAPDEHIEIQDVKKPPERIRLRQLNSENSTEIFTPKSAFQVVTKTTPPNNYLITSPKHTTHSLESRQKHRDSASSIDWHLRRKSYGFEKMSPPDDKAMSRMDASTDSGLGRSGEQLGNWSPTETNAPSTTRATVIHFGGTPAKTASVKPTIQKRYRPIKSPESSEDAELKRHSIAVDESQYVRKTSQIRLKGLYDVSGENSARSLQPTSFLESMDNMTSNTQLQRNSTQQKRVEFCKTEVHFAAESGRVNIVETDGKPPPTNNFRRRRRTTSGPLQTLMQSTGTVSSAEHTTTRPTTLFGDIDGNKVIATSTVAYRASLIESKRDAETTALNNVTFTTPKPISLDAFTHSESSRSSYASTSGVDTTDNETDEISAIRGILKNKPIKPKPYHLGENIESADALWGVQLKPVGTPHQQDSLLATSASVAERVRIAEQRQDNTNLSQVNNFSTKINFCLGDNNNGPVQDLPKSNVMSIELHSPQTSLERPDAVKLIDTPPVAKPRTITMDQNVIQPQPYVATTTATAISKEANRDFLKIVKETRGARKLREHELSYFGVPKTNNNANTDSNMTYKPTMSTSKRNLPQRKLNNQTKIESTSDLTKQQMATKWQLLNDKPDLLRHSPKAVEPQTITRTAEVKPMERKSLKKLSGEIEFENDDEHVYENIAMDIKPVFKVKSPARQTSPSYDEHLYNRKTDLKRDAMILNEMTQNADQTMKALSDEATIKDQRRRSSLQRRNSKPLETIDEKINAEKINDKCIAVQVTRTTKVADVKRQGTPTRTTVSSRARSLSQSSNDSCPRARSRSLSSEREYENDKVRPKRTSQSASRSRTSKYGSATNAGNRSSSRESTHARCCSSGDERDRTVIRMTRSSRSKQTTKSLPSEERKLSSKDTNRQHSEKSQYRRNDEHSKTKRVSSSTAHSSRRERAECNDEVKSKQHSYHHHHNHENNSHERTHPQRIGDSSSSRKYSEEQHKLVGASRPSSSDKRERDRLRTSDRHQSSESSQLRSSHHRSEREREKEKSSRSKGHSSRSSQQKSESTTKNSSLKTREHKKSTQHSNREIKHVEPNTTSTHSKNTPLINGHHHQQSNSHHHNGHHEHEHIHSLTTATIAAKQREHRSGRDRK